MDSGLLGDLCDSVVITPRNMKIIRKRCFLVDTHSRWDTITVSLAPWCLPCGRPRQYWIDLQPSRLILPKLPPPPYLHILKSVRGFTILRWILGLLLLTTAILKLSGGSGEIMRAALPFVSPQFYFAAVLFEAILGLWLIAGFASVGSWLAAISLFTILGLISLR